MHMGSLGSSWRIVWIFVDGFSYVLVDLDSFSWRCNVYKAAMLHHVEFQYCESTSNYKRLGILDGYRWLLAISEPHRGLWDQTFSIKSFEKQPFFLKFNLKSTVTVIMNMQSWHWFHASHCSPKVNKMFHGVFFFSCTDALSHAIKVCPTGLPCSERSIRKV